MPDQAVRSGAQRLAKLDNADLPSVVRVHATDCVCQTVKTGCTIVLQAVARWTYIYVNINPVSDFEQLWENIAGYSDSEDGIVAWKQG
jgi:predicted metal-binding protein